MKPTKVLGSNAVVSPEYEYGVVKVTHLYTDGFWLDILPDLESALKLASEWNDCLALPLIQ